MAWVGHKNGMGCLYITSKVSYKNGRGYSYMTHKVSIGRCGVEHGISHHKISMVGMHGGESMEGGGTVLKGGYAWRA